MIASGVYLLTISAGGGFSHARTNELFGTVGTMNEA